MNSNLKIIYADTFFKRFKGLMGKNKFEDCLVFVNLVDSSVHTLFMKFEIDVYFLDEKQIVFDKVTLKPWKFYKPHKNAKFILETRKNRLDFKIGDEIDFL